MSAKCTGDDVVVILQELHASVNLMSLILSWNFCLNSIRMHFVMPANIVFFVAFVPRSLTQIQQLEVEVRI